MYDKRYRPDVRARSACDVAGKMSDDASSSSSSSLTLSKFVAECPLPSVVQVLAGCYGNVGVNRDNELYVHSTSEQTAVVAETLTPGRMMTMTSGPVRRLRTSASQTLSLPLDYDGPFNRFTGIIRLVDSI